MEPLIDVSFLVTGIFVLSCGILAVSVGSAELADKICEVCGDNGKAEMLVTCCHCKKTTQHIYCMVNQRPEVPALWRCEVCRPVSNSNMVEGGTANASKRRVLIDQPNIGISEVSNKRGLLSKQFANNGLGGAEKKVGTLGKVPHSYSRGTAPNKIVSPNKLGKAQKTKFLSDEEVVTLKSGLRSMPNRRVEVTVPKIHEKKVMQHNILKAVNVHAEANKATVNVYTRKSASIASAKPKESPVLAPVNEDPFDANTSKPPTKCRTGVIDKDRTAPSAKQSAETDPKAVNVLAQAKRGRQASTALADPKELCVRFPVNKELFNADAFKTPTKCTTVVGDKDQTTQRTKQSGIVSRSNYGSGFEEMSLPVLDVSPKRQAFWTGTFKVYDLASYEYNGIQAQFPSNVSSKVYDISKCFSEVLSFTILQREKVWPKMFQLDPPMERDIGLYFFPSESERQKEKYICLVEQLDSRDQAMQGWVDNVELLVFASNQLPGDSQRKYGQHYLWAVLRHMKHKKASQPIKVEYPPSRDDASIRTENRTHRNLSFERNYSTGRLASKKEIVLKDKSTPSFKTPDGPPPGFENYQKQLSVPIDRGTVAGAIDPDIPPGFRKKVAEPIDPHVPPGFFKKVINPINPDIRLNFKHQKRSPEAIYNSRDHVPSTTAECYSPTVSKSREVHPNWHQGSDQANHPSYPSCPSEVRKGHNTFTSRGGDTKSDLKGTNLVSSSPMVLAQSSSVDAKDPNWNPEPYAKKMKPIELFPGEYMEVAVKREDQKQLNSPKQQAYPTSTSKRIGSGEPLEIDTQNKDKTGTERKTDTCNIRADTKSKGDFEEVDMDIDMIGGEETGKVDVAILRVDDQNTEPNTREASSTKMSTVRLTFSPKCPSEFSIPKNPSFFKKYQ